MVGSLSHTLHFLLVSREDRAPPPQGMGAPHPSLGFEYSLGTLWALHKELPPALPPTWTDVAPTTRCRSGGPRGSCPTFLWEHLSLLGPSITPPLSPLSHYITTFLGIPSAFSWWGGVGNTLGPSTPGFPRIPPFERGRGFPTHSPTLPHGVLFWSHPQSQYSHTAGESIIPFPVYPPTALAVSCMAHR